MNEPAGEDGCSWPHVRSVIRLAYLAFDITRAIVNGSQLAELTLADLMDREIPIDWAKQRRNFAFF